MPANDLQERAVKVSILPGNSPKLLRLGFSQSRARRRRLIGCLIEIRSLSLGALGALLLSAHRAGVPLSQLFARGRHKVPNWDVGKGGTLYTPLLSVATALGFDEMGMGFDWSGWMDG